MTDPIAALLNRTADQFAAGVTAPLAAVQPRPQRSTVRRVLLPAAAAAAVVGVAAAAVAIAPGRSGRTIVYAATGPELGTVQAPRNQGGAGIFDTAAAGGTPTEVDLLARVEPNQAAELALVGARTGGQVCVGFGLLPPAVNQGFDRLCTDGDPAPYGDQPLVAAGTGPATEEINGIDLPAAAYGSAPPGTRTVELARDGKVLRVKARDAGPHYKHRAYWAAAWDLGGGPTTIRALNADGEEVARSRR
jgi:hypothetical protein